MILHEEVLPIALNANPERSFPANVFFQVIFPGRSFEGTSNGRLASAFGAARHREGSRFVGWQFYQLLAGGSRERPSATNSPLA
jgi:hypothetical protein